MKEELILNRNELDELENKLSIFFSWIQGNIDEAKLNNNDLEIIKFGQLYTDLLISDDNIYFLLDHLNCHGVDELLNNQKKLEIAEILLSQDKKIIKAKLICLQKRRDQFKNKKRTLTKTN